MAFGSFASENVPPPLVDQVIWLAAPPKTPFRVNGLFIQSGA